MPPLAKFAAAPFGVVERFAEPDGLAMLPITLRRVEHDLKAQALTLPQGKVSDLKPETDAEIIAWWRKVQRYDSYTVSRKQAARDLRSPLPAATARCVCERSVASCARPASVKASPAA